MVSRTSHAGNRALNNPKPPSHQAKASSASRKATAPSHGDHITAADPSNPSTPSISGKVNSPEPGSSGRETSSIPRFASTAAPASASGKN